jgi:PST family polysaccharide transporter
MDDDRETSGEESSTVQPWSDPTELAAERQEAAALGEGPALEATPSGDEANLRETAIQGGGYLAAREIAGIGLRSLGIIAITRIIGPSSFGLYAAAAAFATLIGNAAQMGMEVFLIRQPEEPTDELYQQVFTFLLVISVLAAGMAIGASFLVVQLDSSLEAPQRLFIVLAASIPINVLWAPAQAKIERSFGYKRMAWLEFGGDAIFYAVATALALLGAGAWCLVAGFVAWQSWLFVGSLRFSHLSLRWNWSSSVNRSLLHHGSSYSSAGILQAATGLINPIVVGAFFGSAGVGYVALSQRLIDTLSFAARATWRLGMVTLTKVSSSASRLARGVEQAMTLQLLATLGPILGVCVLANWLVPFAFGPTWTPMIPVLAWLGMARIAASPITIEFAVLYVKSKNVIVAIATGLGGLVTLLFALVLVPTIGLAGYGIATLLSVVSMLYLHPQTLRVSSFSLLPCLRVMLPVLPITLFPLVAMPYAFLLFAPALLAARMPSIRREVTSNAGLVWNGLVHPNAVKR